LKNFYRREINLFFSTTGIHESTLERGYSIWVNFSYLYAFKQMQMLANRFDEIEVKQGHLHFAKSLENSASRVFVRDGAFIRRMTAKGRLDFRHDITQMTPFYYGFIENYGDIIAKTMNILDFELWDPELGGLQRYLPFTEDLATHIHAGNGPWLQYTAIMAQYHFSRGDMRRGDDVLALIDQYRDDRGHIPEHISTRERFEEFLRLEWKTGLDVEKNFFKEMLLPNVDYNRIADEIFLMKKAYDNVMEVCQREDIPDKGHIKYVVPLAWSHAEYIVALIRRIEGQDKYPIHSFFGVE